MRCPQCSADVPADDRFCEECGAVLAVEAVAGDAPPCACGAPGKEVDEEGFCLRCGRKARVVQASDRIEITLAPQFAGVSDRGLRHDRNEDRFGLAAEGGGYALVVCDGVSSTRSSEIASEAVTEGVLEALAEALREGAIADPEACVRAAVAAGALRLEAKTRRATGRVGTSASRKLRAGGQADGQAPSTTVVAALVQGGRLTVGWVGDSRAYWIDSHGAEQLTRDHSWLNEMVNEGTMTAEEAARSPKAHAITRWIGADAAESEEADVVSRTLDPAGRLLLCTDGLWNYAASAAEMTRLIGNAGGEGRDAAGTSRELVRFALEHGGVDNITVAVLGWAGPDGIQTGNRLE